LYTKDKKSKAAIAPALLKVLKKGFTALKNHVGKCKKANEYQLKCKKCIDNADTEWLDNQANLINEECALADLENASDY
jgi:hypothetical protein